MSIFDQISFGVGRRLPLLLQTEATECGLACLGMVASYYGHRTDIASLRRQFAISLKGVTLASLLKMANSLELATRPLKLDLEHLSQLRLPCILHWNFNHFVVLKEVNNKVIVIHDPAVGRRVVGMEEVSKSFTGVALECWPKTGFKTQAPAKAMPLRSLMGRVTGLARSFAQIIMLALSLEVFALVSPFFMQWVIDDVIVSANVFAHLVALPLHYFEKRHLGDVVSRFGSIDQIQHTLTTSFLEAILDGVMSIVTLVMMFIYSATLGWIAVAAMVLYGLARWAWYRPLRDATQEQIIHAAKQQSHFLETVRGVKAIKLFQRPDERRSTWLTLLVDQINAELRTQKLQIAYKLINGLLFGVENCLIVWLGAKLVLEGNFTVGVLTAFVAYKGQFEGRVSSLIDKFFELRMLQLQGERLADIVTTEPEQIEGQRQGLGQVGLSQDVENLPATLSVQHLRYRYAEHEPYVLDSVSFTIAAGESVAIVGASGCGKTTLLNVLLGILPCTEGDVLIGGMNVKQVGIATLRSMVATVLQDDVLFAGSIADNISFFDPQIDTEWMQQCAVLAAIAPEIMAMPMGFNTLVGDMGTVLSGGQKQRVLLARALYKRPKILFLDEATSHLDVAKEHEVNAAIQSLAITRIIVAHRPETIASANRVIVLMGGKVVQDVLVPKQSVDSNNKGTV